MSDPGNRISNEKYESMEVEDPNPVSPLEQMSFNAHDVKTHKQDIASTSKENRISWCTIWTKEADQLLLDLVQKHGNVGKQVWEFISSHFKGRSTTACRQHYRIICHARENSTKGAPLGIGPTSEIAPPAVVAVNRPPTQPPVVSYVFPTTTDARTPLSPPGNWSDDENKELLLGYLSHGAAWDDTHSRIVTKSVEQIQQHWYHRVCPIVNKFFTNYYHPRRFMDVNSPCMDSCADLDAGVVSCPLYGVSDVPFLIEAVRIGAAAPTGPSAA
jgi:hypothetical protein